MDTIVDLLQSFGFPIVMCLVMAYYVKYQSDKEREDRNGQNERHAKEREDMNSRHEKEVDTMRSALDANTEALHALEKTLVVISEGRYRNDERN